MKNWSEKQIEMMRRAWDNRHEVRRMSDRGMTQKEIAAALGLSRSRINQMLHRAYYDIRHDRKRR